MSIPLDSIYHINTRILQTMVSAILLVLGLSSRMSDRYVSVVLGPLEVSLTLGLLGNRRCARGLGEGSVVRCW